MFRGIATLTLVLVLISAVGQTSARAQAFQENEVKAAETGVTSSATGELSNEKLRTAVNKLVDDVKAGRIAPAAKPQIQTKNSNHLSKGTKIAIGVGIAVAIVAIIVVVKADKGPDSIRIFP